MQTTEDDRRMAQIKASLLARVDELGRRIKDARDKFDIKAHIASHPLVAMSVAAAVGALLGLRAGERSAPSSEDVERSMGAAAMAALAGIAIRVAKDLAVRQLVGATKSWIDGQDSQTEASRDPSVEAFLQH